MPTLKTAIAVALFAVASLALAVEAPLTNADILKMTAAGLSSETIIAKIGSSHTAFTTDAESLVALANAKVADAVIRAMVEHKPAAKKTPAEPRRRRFENVTVEAPGGGRCTQADLEVTTKGLQTTSCHEADVKVVWADVTSVCYVYGSRPTMSIRTVSAERRIFFTTPAELKALRDSIRERAPNVAERSDCR